MPFLLLDDATDEATRRLQEFGQGLLQPIGQTFQQAGQTVQPGPQVVPPGAAIPNAQAATQRLQDFGSSLLQPLIPQAPTQIQPQEAGGLQDITQRLQDHGQQVLNQAMQAAQQVTTQLLPQPQEGQFFGPGAQQAQANIIPSGPETPRGGDLQSYARQAAQRVGLDPDIFVRQIQQESGFNPSAKSPAGAQGIAQIMPQTAQGWGVDPSDPYASLDAAARNMAAYAQQYGGIENALRAYNAGPGNIAASHEFGETNRYVQNILGGAKQAVQGAVQGAQQAVSNVLPAVSQFGDKQLSAAEAYAACGPAAAVRFAQMFGRQPTLQEAIGLAQQVGWTADQGMAGLGSESRLFDKMDIPHRMVGADWQALAREAQSGNPVTLSTPGHYFTADGYDPSSGAFHVGSSGTDLKGGSEWMTPAQMESRMGKLQGGMAVDNPQVPGSSPLSQGAQMLGQKASDFGSAVQRGLQDLTTAVPPGQVFKRAGQGLQAAADVMLPGSPASDITRAAGGLLQQPGPLEAMQTVQDLNDKYAAAPSAFKLGGQVVHVDPGDMSAEDAQRYNQAALVAGATSAPPEGTTRMYHGTGADFPSVSPEAVSGTGNLFGPGYYMTTSPDVAGGRVSRGQIGINPETGRTSDYDPTTGKFTTYMTGGGELQAPGYAQARTKVDANELADLLQSVHDDVSGDAGYHGYFQQSTASDIRQLAAGAQQLADTGQMRLAGTPMSGESAIQYITNRLEAILSRDVPNPETYVKTLRPDIFSRGGNVRALDVPQDLNLLNIEGPVSDEQLKSVGDAIARRTGDPIDSQSFVVNTRSQNRGNVTGDALYTGLRNYIQDWLPGRPGAGADLTTANQILADAGFDGITYAGGQRIPMRDAAGNAIEHQATVVFPENVGKIRNAISGTMGGAAQTGFAAGLGGLSAAGLGAKTLLDQNFQSPLTLEAVTQNPLAQDIGQNILGPLLGIPNLPIQGMGQGLGPSVLDSMQTISDLNEKYKGTPLAQRLPMKGAEPLTITVDPAVMSPEDADAYRRAIGAVAGVSQADLGNIRSLNLNANVFPPRGPRGPIANLVDLTKQFMLSGPPTHVSNTIGNTIQLLKSPVALTLGGRPRDAWAGVEAVGKAMPEAFGAMLDAARGTSRASLATPAGSSGRWYEPVFRALSASDAFTRTLAEYQGMAEHASHLLSEAGMSPNSKGASAFLLSKAAEIADMGRARGSQAVFMTDKASGTSRLDQLADLISKTKEGLLASPDLKNQALGALLDTQLPFLGVPTRILQVGSRQLPGISQATTLYRMTNASSRAEAQRALGEGIMETAIQIGLAYQIANGNIRGPDDPDHPNEANILGNWVNLNSIAGAYALPAQIMAAAYEGYNKPLTSADQDELTRVGNALNSSIKPLAQAVPGLQMMHFLASLGSGQGLTGAAQQEISDTLSRIAAPGAGKFVEDVVDPIQRDIAKQGPASLYEPTMARIPGLAERLPARIDLTTGEPMEKRRAGPGVLLGVESYDESAFREVANKLAKQGYDTKPPTTYPNQVSIAGSTINLKPDEQRQVAQITGQYLGNLSARVQTPEFQNASEVRQAAVVKALLDAQVKARESAVAQVLGRDELRARILKGQKDTGRLRAQETPVIGNLLGNLSTSLSDQLAGAGVSARP